MTEKNEFYDNLAGEWKMWNRKDLFLFWVTSLEMWESK